MSAVHGVVLAGGRGTRLGLGVAKARVRLGGRSLIARAIETLEPLCDAVTVVAPEGIAADLASETAGREVVFDAPGGKGPLAGLVAGLSLAHARGAEWAVALAVDLPFLRAETLAALLELARRERTLALLPAPDGLPQPLAAIYSAAAAPRLAAAFAAGVRGANEAVGALGARLVRGAELEALPGGAAAFANVNTAGDLAEAERRLARQGSAGAAR